MKTHGYGRWAVLALLLILAVPMRADARDWYYHHHVVVRSYGVPAYRVAPTYVTVPSYAAVPSYGSYGSYGAVPSYGVVPSVASAYAPYPYGYRLSKAQIGYYNRLGRIDRWEANHPRYAANHAVLVR
jgi:hypothetical protein